MEYFLEKIARTLYLRYGNTLNEHCVIFPSRRAGLYFLKYLAAIIEKPVWIPSIMTISDLFRSYSTLTVAENEQLLYELYKVYRELTPNPESFDEFYYWGDMLINDFDDVDKYLVNASLLFSNIKDIKNIDDRFGELTSEQVEVIRSFWTNFNPSHTTDEKAGFIKTWAILNDLYIGFRESLRNKKLAYEGMIFRDIAGDDSFKNNPDPGWKMIHFIGFNALNNCEKKLMVRLREAGIAQFYWDYDNSYLSQEKPVSAGLFMRDNIKLFGNDMPSDWDYNTLLSKGNEKVRRRVIATSSDVAQVKMIPDLIAEIEGLSPENAHHTAVVLADENLLMPVLTSLPMGAGDINITMGYPLRQTQVYSFIRHLLLLQKNAKTGGDTVLFNHADVISLLRNELLVSIIKDDPKSIINDIIKKNLVWIPGGYFSNSETLSQIFIKAETPSRLSEYLKRLLEDIYSGEIENTGQNTPAMAISVRNEYIYRVILSLNRLESVISDPDFSVSVPTYIRILDKILRSQSVPFSGEPLSGIQVMGILETRTLDFKNLIMLSVNEGILPAVSAGASFIPFNLRVAFGLPDTSHQESVFAYHFFRLLQRAENVALIYNSNPEGLKTGEMSRFVLQMKYSRTLVPEFKSVGFEITTAVKLSNTIERTTEHSEALISRFDDPSGKRLLSPSAINTWLGCRMRFYYQYVCNLREPETVVPEIDAAHLGNLLHSVMKKLYTPILGKETGKKEAELILKDESGIKAAIVSEFSAIFGEWASELADGRLLIAMDVLKEYVGKIIRTDISVAPFKIIAMEKEFSFPVSVRVLHKEREIRTGGVIDRIDDLSGTVRIVDYKTGRVSDRVSSIMSLFANDRPKDHDGWLQILLYCEAFLRMNPGVYARPSVYRIRRSAGGGESDRLRVGQDAGPDLIVTRYDSVRDSFAGQLAAIIKTIFNDNEPFEMTNDQKKCNYCPYRGICMRKT